MEIGLGNKCDICGSQFANKKYLKNHINRTHKQSFECAKCNSTPVLSKTESAQSLFTNKLKFQRREMTCLLSSVKF